jgi:hypothetical protein
MYARRKRSIVLIVGLCVGVIWCISRRPIPRTRGQSFLYFLIFHALPSVSFNSIVVYVWSRGRGFDSRSRLLYIVWTNLCFSLFISSLYIVLVFDHTLMRKGSVGCSCRAMGSKILSCGMVHQGIEGRYVRPWSLNLLFCRRGFGLVVSVVVPSMLAVMPYARGRGYAYRVCISLYTGILI